MTVRFSRRRGRRPFFWAKPVVMRSAWTCLSSLGFELEFMRGAKADFGLIGCRFRQMRLSRAVVGGWDLGIKENGNITLLTD